MRRGNVTDIEWGTAMSDDALLARLQQWATTHGLTRDPYVARLLAALERDQDLAYWATVNPLELLPSPSTSASKYLRWSRQIALWRNVTIFIPLALTWYAIAEATSAFEEFVSRNSTATANFLEFWQNGYGILPEFWRIGSVARFDVYIILVIIAMSLASGLLHARATQIDASENDRFEQERVGLALDISRHLHSMRAVTPASIGDDVVEAIHALRQLTRDLTQAAEQVSTAHTNTADLAPKLTLLLEQLSNLVATTEHEVHQSGAALGDALRTLVTATAELQNAVRVDIAGAGAGLASAAKDVEQRAIDLQRRLSALLDPDR